MLLDSLNLLVQTGNARKKTFTVDDTSGARSSHIHCRSVTGEKNTLAFLYFFEPGKVWGVNLQAKARINKYKVFNVQFCTANDLWLNIYI